MSQIERRKYPRVKIFNTISYIGYDTDNNIIEQNIGVAIDVSQTGLLIASTQKVESEYLSLVASNQNDELIKIEARVAYCRKVDTGKYHMGMILQGSNDESIQFVKELIRAFHYRKKYIAESVPES
jgi:hypothetical protein